MKFALLHSSTLQLTINNLISKKIISVLGFSIIFAFIWPLSGEFFAIFNDMIDRKLKEVFGDCILHCDLNTNITKSIINKTSEKPDTTPVAKMYQPANLIFLSLAKKRECYWGPIHCSSMIWGWSIPYIPSMQQDKHPYWHLNWQEGICWQQITSQMCMTLVLSICHLTYKL